MNWVRTFQVAAAAFAIIAVFLLLTDPRSDYLFAAVILIICSLFLSYRFHLKQRIDSRGSDEEQD